MSGGESTFARCTTGGGYCANPPAEMHAQSSTTVGEHHLNELPLLRVALYLPQRNLNLLACNLDRSA